MALKEPDQIDKALDKFLTPIIAVGAGIAVIAYVIANFWHIILLLLLVTIGGYAAWTNREGLMSFFKSLFGPPPYIPPPPPKPHPEYAKRLGQALQKQLELDGLPFPPNDIFTQAVFLGAKLVNDEPYLLPDVLDPHRETEREVQSRNIVMKHFGLEGNETYEEVGPKTLELMREMYPTIPEKAGDVVFESLLAYFRNFPVAEEGPFRAPIATKINFAHVIYEMLEPFKNQVMLSFHLMPHITKRFHNNVKALPPTGSELTWPQHFKGPPEQMPEIYLKGHPFLPLFQVTVPCQSFSDKDRFSHQWVMAPQGTGKTVLLCNQINHDLDRVARGECSLFVMDSQDRELGKYLPRLHRFAPGGDLEGRLIYLEPDHNYPLALNPFDFTNATPAEVEQSIVIFMSAFEPPTERMQTIISYAMRALALIPNPTIMHFKDLLKPGARKEPSGFQLLAQQYPQLNTLEQSARTFLSDGVHSQGYAQSLSGLQARLDLFLADPFFEKMFTSQNSPIDLGDMLSKPNVVVVNTKTAVTRTRLKAFGLYFIGKLIQAYQSRMDVDAPIPCFAYIDEVGDYVKENAQVAEIFWKARKQNFGMIVAHQDVTNVGADVMAAFQNAAIVARPEREQGKWNFTVRGKSPQRLDVPVLEFSHLPQMTRPEWSAILADMRSTYAQGTKPHADVPQAQQTPPDEQMAFDPNQDAE